MRAQRIAGSRAPARATAATSRAGCSGRTDRRRMRHGSRRSRRWRRAPVHLRPPGRRHGSGCRRNVVQPRFDDGPHGCRKRLAGRRQDVVEQRRCLDPRAWILARGRRRAAHSRRASAHRPEVVAGVGVGRARRSISGPGPSPSRSGRGVIATLTDGRVCWSSGLAIVSGSPGGRRSVRCRGRYDRWPGLRKPDG